MAKIVLEFDDSLQLQAIGCNDDDLGAAVKGALLYAGNIEPTNVLHECRENEIFIFNRFCAAIDARKARVQKISEARRKAIANRWNKRNINQ